MTTRSFVRNGHLAGLAQTDRPRRSRRQIYLPASHKGAAIVDPHNNAAAVAHPNKRSKRQSAVSRGHCRTIETFSVGGATAAQTVTTTIDACNFRTRELAAAKQHRGPQKQFQIAREHIPISPVFDPSKHEGFDGIPKPSQSNQNWSPINGKISAEVRERS
jgi:hypothetical protein